MFRYRRTCKSDQKHLLRASVSKQFERSGSCTPETRHCGLADKIGFYAEDTEQPLKLEPKYMLHKRALHAKADFIKAYRGIIVYNIEVDFLPT